MPLYVLNAEGTDLYKIGITSGSVRERVKALQTGCPFPIKIAGVYEVSGQSREEKRWHSRFAAKRTSGEWFALTPAEREEIEKAYHAPPAGRNVVHYVGLTVGGREWTCAYTPRDDEVYLPLAFLPDTLTRFVALGGGEALSTTHGVMARGGFVVETLRGIPAADWKKMKVDASRAVERTLEAIAAVRECATS